MKPTLNQMKSMKVKQNILGLAAIALIVIGGSGCDSKDSGGGSPGEGSGTKTNAAIRGSISVAAFAATMSSPLLAQGSGTKPAKPSGGSGSKTNAPAGGSGTKTNKPAGGSGLKSA